MTQTIPLGDIADVIVGVPAKPSNSGGPPNVLTVRALTGHGIDPEGLDVVDFGRRNVDRYRVKPGDVLFPARSTSIKADIVTEEHSGMVINSSLTAVRLRPDLHPRLLVAWFAGEEGREALESHQSGTAIKSITAGALKSIPVPSIPRAEQEQLVALLEAADEVYASGLAAAENRRQIARETAIQRMKGQSHGNQ